MNLYIANYRTELKSLMNKLKLKYTKGLMANIILEQRKLKGLLYGKLDLYDEIKRKLTKL
jgi:hypothetical protein